MWEQLFSLVSGGGLGFLGSMVSSVTDIFKQREENRHDEKMMELENQHVKMETEKDVQVSRMETIAQKEEAEAEADAQVRSRSYEMDQRRYLSKKAMAGNVVAVVLMASVDFVRGMTRPVLTLYLAVLSTMIFWKVQEITGGMITSEEQAAEILRITTMGLLHFFGMSLAWWFGSRSKFLGGSGFKRSKLKVD